MAKSRLEKIPKEQLPVHIGLIMDGNGRWAKKRGLPRTAGHKSGAEVFAKIAKHCREIGIKHLTIYAFSTENWKRPQQEVQELMEILRRHLKEIYKHQEEDVRLCFIGDKGPLSEDLCQMMEEIEQKSANRKGICINIALNYGGREEIVHAARTLARDCMNGKLSPEQIDEQLFADRLYTAGQPDPDLIIRPSGEMRTSNFLPWQSTYAELVFMDVLWPDFTPAHLDDAILEYLGRSRRFGGV